MATITAVIPTIKGREELLQKLLDSLPKSMEKLIIRDEDLPLAAKRNKGALQAKGKYILFIDDDNYLKPGAVEAILKHFDISIGVMGLVACYDSNPEVVADGGSVRNYATGFMEGKFTNAKVKRLPQLPYEVNEVANAFVMRRQLHRWIGGFDEVNFPIDLDEADICRRVKDMGFKIVMNPQAQCCHKSQTYSWLPDFRRPKNAYFMGRNKILYAKKHRDYLALFSSPAMVFAYCAALVYRKKFSLIPHFLKGVFDGLSGRTKNQYQ